MKTPHPRTRAAVPRGIKFPISDQIEPWAPTTPVTQDAAPATNADTIIRSLRQLRSVIVKSAPSKATKGRHIIRLQHSQCSLSD